MARASIGILDNEKKKRNLIQPTQSIEGQKLFNTQGITPVTNALKSAVTNKLPTLGATQDLVKKEIIPERNLTAEELGIDPVATPIVDETKGKLLQDAITNQGVEETIVEPPKTTNITDLIKRRNAETTNALVANIRKRIAEGQAGQQGIIDSASQQFDPLRAQSEVQRNRELKSSLEISANQGDRGGVGRTAALLTQTEGGNRLNQISLAQQNVITNAKAEIARLENEGKFDEAQVVAAQASQELDQLITQARNDEVTAREDRRLSLETEDRAFDDELATISQYSNDFTAEIQRRQATPDTADDKLIPFLEAAKQNKIQTQGLDQQGNPLSVDQTPELTSSSALSLWEQTGVANEAISRALGIPVGTEYTRRSTGGSGTSGLTDTGIRFKLTNKIPLSAAEAAKYGVEEGFLLPDDTEGTAQEEADAATDADLLEYIQSKGGDTKQSVIEYLINNDGRYSIEKGFDIMDTYDLSPIDLQRVQNVNPSIGQ